MSSLSNAIYRARFVRELEGINSQDFWFHYERVQSMAARGVALPLIREAIDRMAGSVVNDFEDHIYCTLKDYYYGEE